MTLSHLLVYFSPQVSVDDLTQKNAYPGNASLSDPGTTTDAPDQWKCGTDTTMYAVPGYILTPDDPLCYSMLPNHPACTGGSCS